MNDINNTSPPHLTWIDKQKQKIKKIVSNNKIELFLIFIIIFAINLINTFNNNTNISGFKHKGGQLQSLDLKTLAITQAASQGPNPQEQMMKTQITINVFTQILNYLMSHKTFNSIVCFIGSIIKSVFVFAGLIVAISFIPILPLFAFMFVIFIILRKKVATLKSL
jgi:hypothetical protein